jgi:hypothetical protein
LEAAVVEVAAAPQAKLYSCMITFFDKKTRKQKVLD